MRPNRTIYFLSILTLAGLAACQRHEVTWYEIPKETPAPPQAMPSTAEPPQSAQPAISWQLPEGWRDLGPHQVRRGNFQVARGGQMAEIIIVDFPLETASPQNFIRHLAGELQADGETAATEDLTLGGKRFQIISLQGEDSQQRPRAVTAALHAGAHRFWLFNMTGDAQIVSRERDNFLSLLESVEFTAAPSPVPGSMASQTLPPGAVSTAGNPHWSVPAGWESGPPSQMRRGSFLVNTADGQSVDISITAFPGDVGGALMNINRWRSQIGLGPISESEAGMITQSIEIDGMPATLVDFSGDSPPSGKNWPQRSIVATLMREGNSWFFKITGDAPLVETQREAFLSFLESVHF